MIFDLFLKRKFTRINNEHFDKLDNKRKRATKAHLTYPLRFLFLFNVISFFSFFLIQICRYRNKWLPGWMECYSRPFNGIFSKGEIDFNLAFPSLFLRLQRNVVNLIPSFVNLLNLVPMSRKIFFSKLKSCSCEQMNKLFICFSNYLFTGTHKSFNPIFCQIPFSVLNWMLHRFIDLGISQSPR